MSFQSIWHNGLCLITPRPLAKLMWSLQNHISLTSSVHPLIPPHGSVPSGRSGRSGAKSSVLRGVLIGKVSNVPSESVPSDKSSPHVYLRPLLEHLHAEIAKEAKSRSNLFGKMSAAINGAVRCVLAATFVRTGPPNFFFPWSVGVDRSRKMPRNTNRSGRGNRARPRPSIFCRACVGQSQVCRSHPHTCTVSGLAPPHTNNIQQHR